MRVLLVEDDEALAAMLTDALKIHHYSIDRASNGVEGLRLADAFSYDLVLLDVMLPKLDGIQICQKLRSQGKEMPILLLTARNSSSDRVRGLDAGADDYLVKPFDMNELLARIRALARRQAKVMADLSWGRLTLNPDLAEVKYGDRPIHLTPKEYALLELFLANPRRVFSRSAILDRLWSLDEYPGEETITTHIKSLRQRLKTAGLAENPIETVYGLGYRLTPPPVVLEDDRALEEAQPNLPDVKEDSSIAETPALPVSPPEPASKAQVERMTRSAAAVSALWEKFRSTFEEQIAAIDRATTALKRGELTPDLQQQARQDAHKLAGSLGTFGFQHGSELAREMEVILESPIAPAAVEKVVALNQSLKDELARGPSPLMPASAIETVATSHKRPLQVLLVDDDVALTAAIEQAAIAWNWQLVTAITPTIARQHLSPQPDVVLLDLTFPESDEDGLALLDELNRDYPKLPVLALTGRNSFTDRVEVARLGGRGFIQKPIAPERLHKAVTQTLQHHNPADARILIVDDDPAILSALTHLLEPWGMAVTPLSDPHQFWDTLSCTRPDLLILDVEMPDINGFDLCQVVRNDADWNGLPILILSAHTDAATVQRVFTSGADDYIQKPVREAELIARVLNRLDRVRTLQKLSETQRKKEYG